MPVSGSKGYRSGFLNLPPRVQLREMDNYSGRYPTIGRTGDQDNAGSKNIYYDDNRTMVFGNNTTTKQLVYYPSLIPVNYPNGPAVSSPNQASSITMERSVISGISDMLLVNSSTLAPDTPFNESRVYLSTGSFYATGTDPGVLPGFSQPLGNKVQITIPLDPVEETSIWFSTGTLPHATPYATRGAGLAAGINSGLAYYNFNLRKWEIIGDITSGSNVDVNHQLISVSTGAMHTTIQGPPGVSFTFTPGVVDRYASLLATSGRPINYCGFPVAEKFNATGSQLLDMSNYINHPFLLEKVVFEWTGSLRTFPIRDAGEFAYWYAEAPQASNFMILNQWGTEISTTKITTPSNTVVSFPENPDLVFHSASGPFPVTREKDLVFHSTIGTSMTYTNEQLGALGYPYLKRDLLVCGAPRWRTAGVTGSFRLEKRVTVPGFFDRGMYFRRHIDHGFETSDGTLRQYAGSQGGRDLFGNASGRSFIASTVGAVPLSGAFDPLSVTNQAPEFTVQPYAQDSLERTSPYLIMPTDKLVFAFANQGYPYSNRTSSTPRPRIAEFMAAYSRCNMAAGPSKVTFFGSVLREGFPIPVESNQPLTTDSVHEALHSDNAVVDQFQVEPFETYRGTYIDEIYAGKFLQSPRQVVGRCTEGTQGTTGSLLRGVRLSCQSERYYDSLMPSLNSYYNAADTSLKTFYTPKQYKKLPSRAYYFSGAMESNLAGTETFLNSDLVLPFPYASSPERVLQDPHMLVVSSTQDASTIEVINNYEAIKEVLFKVGMIDQAFTTIKVGATVGSDTQAVTDESANGATGFRYGIANTKRMLSSAVYRYDTYGQFRDMLEQRKDTRYWDLGSETPVGDASVKVLFVNNNDEIIDASQTVSVNSSIHATSSIPFFDVDPALQAVMQQTDTIVISEVDEV